MHPLIRNHKLIHVRLNFSRIICMEFMNHICQAYINEKQWILLG